MSKVVLIGAGGVGKTCIASRLVTGQYIDSKMTIGIDVESWSLEDTESGKSFKVVSFDLGGQPQFRFFQHSMIQGANVGLFVFDTTRYESLMDIVEWTDILDSIPRILFIGNKADLGLTIPEEEIQLLADKYNASWIIVSAMTGMNFDILEEKLMSILESPNES